MKVFVIVLWMCLSFKGILLADSHPATDAEVLINVLSTAIQKILEPHHSLLPGETVALEFFSPCVLSRRARDAVEAIVSDYGSAITDNKRTSGCRLFMNVTDARVLIQPHDKEFTRTVWVTVHMKCLDSSGKVLFASGRDERFEDELSSEFLGLTDDSAHYCDTFQRSIVKKERGSVRFFSAVVITGILAYFAFQ